MKKNFRIHTAALGVLLSATLVSNCSLLSGPATTDDDVLTLTALTGALQLLSGNCAAIVREGSGTAAAPYTYIATGTLIPLGGCNEATIDGTISTDVEAVKTAADTQFDAFTAVASPATCTGANLANTIAGAKTANTSAAIAARASANLSAADGKNEGCTSSITLGTSALGSHVYCLTSADVAKYRARRMYLSVSDVVADMPNALASARTTGDADTNLSDSSVAFMRLMSTSELTTFNSNTTKTILYCLNAVGAGNCNPGGANVTCAVDIIAANSSYKSVLTGMVSNTALSAGAGGLYSAMALLVSAADRQAVTQTKVPNLACGYSYVVPTRVRGNHPTSAIPGCPQSYPTFN